MITGKIAYVTGGMGGIGTSICRKLHDSGHKVIAGCGPNRDFEKWFYVLLLHFMTADLFQLNKFNWIELISKDSSESD